MSISRISPSTETGPVIVVAKLSLKNAVCPKRNFSKKKIKNKGFKDPKTHDLQIDFQYFSPSFNQHMNDYKRINNQKLRTILRILCTGQIYRICPKDMSTWPKRQKPRAFKHVQQREFHQIWGQRTSWVLGRHWQWEQNRWSGEWSRTWNTWINVKNYLEFLSNDSIWGYPPWLTMNTVDWEMVENKKITVFKKDFLNSISALTFLSSSKTYFSPIWLSA